MRETAPLPDRGTRRKPYAKRSIVEGILGESCGGRTIEGAGTNPSGFTEAWIAVIPEPSTALLMGLGLVALGVKRQAYSA